MDYEVFLQWSLVGVQIIQLSGVLLIDCYDGFMLFILVFLINLFISFNI